MPATTLRAPDPVGGGSAPTTPPRAPGPTLHVVGWLDPVTDPYGVHPCSRYVELYWLGTIGPSPGSANRMAGSPLRENATQPIWGARTILESVVTTCHHWA